MRRICMVVSVVILVSGMTGMAWAALVLPDGTVTANRQDSSTGSSAWFGESVTTLTFDAQNVGSGHVEVTGKITDISNIDTSWVEIGLIQKDAWDYWQIAYSGTFKAAVFDKGIYVVHWTEAAVAGLQLQEGWWEGGITKWAKKGPYAWGLSAPTTGAPWEFTISMYPTSSGDAYLSVEGGSISGTSPLVYSGDHGYGDFSECYLIAQIWSLDENATFSFEDVRVEVVPEPLTMLLFAGSVLGGLGAWRRRRGL